MMAQVGCAGAHAFFGPLFQSVVYILHQAQKANMYISTLHISSVTQEVQLLLTFLVQCLSPGRIIPTARSVN